MLRPWVGTFLSGKRISIVKLNNVLSLAVNTMNTGILKGEKVKAHKQKENPLGDWELGII